MAPETETPLPSVPAGALARLRAAYPALSDTEQRVAAFFEQHPAETVLLPIKQLAQRIGVGETTIVRFCQALGYGGLRAYKLALAAEVVPSQQLIDQQITPHDDVMRIASKVFQADIQAINDTLAMLDSAVLERVVQALHTARRIELYGSGASAPLVGEIHYRLLRIGLPVVVVTDSLLQAISASQLRAGDVAFAVSHTGRTRMTVNALAQARAAGATCILLTSFAQTPLGQHAHLQLVTATQETALRTEARSSRISHLSLVNVIYMALAMRRGSAASAVYAQSNDLIEDAMVDQGPALEPPR